MSTYYVYQTDFGYLGVEAFSALVPDSAGGELASFLEEEEKEKEKEKEKERGGSLLFVCLGMHL